MNLSKVVIENYKCFRNRFTFLPNKGLNILVGDNEAGKSTILEAIHLALTGMLNGKYLKNELSQYLFNVESVKEYISRINSGSTAQLPYILIELSIEGGDLAIFEGNGNIEGKKDCGISFKIAFDDKYQQEYEELIKAKNIQSIPIEYYEITWISFARQGITSKSIPLKSALIDSSSSRYQNGSDIYISRIIRENLEAKEIVDITQAYRKMQDIFVEEKAIQAINQKIQDTAKISKKDIKISVDLSSRNAWESSLMAYLDEIPFHYIGKGEQCIVKTRLALGHKKSLEANVILLEEPENHLSHSKLNELLKSIKENIGSKQIIISTHSSYVANKLGLESLILLNASKTIKLKELDPDTSDYFRHLSGYDTLRLLLCKKAILVEGDSDELILQKAYMDANSGKLPIEDGIDVISVGLSFLRFLELAEKISKPVTVVTDNDGNVEALLEKYKEYVGEKAKPGITICFDRDIDSGELVIGKSKRPFNYNTLEPKLLKENSLKAFNQIFKTNYMAIDEMHKFMKNNKTECALKIFETQIQIKYPKYILDAII